jgi:GDPmannose 4,6-dehydratase
MNPLIVEKLVTRKITRATSRIALGLQDKFYLGNLIRNDWDMLKIMYMMWMILQADDRRLRIVITTGKQPGEFCTHELC